MKASTLQKKKYFQGEVRQGLSPDRIIMINGEIDKTDPELICKICSGLVVGPNKCSKCKDIFCQACISDYLCKYNKCPNKCIGMTLLDVDDPFKIKLDKIIISCPTCQENVSLFKYPEHLNITHQKKCFNCDSVNYKSTNKKIQFLTYLELEKKSDPNIYKFCNIPKEIKSKLFFQIMIKTDKYKGFIASTNDGWLEFTRYRPAASFFSFRFENSEQFLQMFDKRKNKWCTISPSYQKGVGIFEVGYGGIKVDPFKHQIISSQGLTKGYPLTLRVTDFFFFFYEPSDLYQICSIDCLFFSEE